MGAATDPAAASGGRGGAGNSQAFHLLDSRIQRWIWQKRWPALRQAQEQAIPPILAADTDLVICAATAAGKTEAAFLPICTALLRERDTSAGRTQPGDARPGAGSTGVKVVYVSPLKALINDQWGRLDGLCEHLEIPVHRWHGDVSSSRKTALLKQPDGILLITPESLEALFVNHGSRLPSLLAGLHYMVIDEMHAFMGTPRGAQLQSLLHRVDLAVRRRTPRVGLSATLGDTSQARAFLRPDLPDRVTVVSETGQGGELRLQLRGYLTQAAVPPPAASTPGHDRQHDQGPHAGPGDQPGAAGQDDENEDNDENEDADALAIGAHLFQVLRGTSNLVFANSRSNVERYADRLARMSAQQRLPNEFLPHHGSLSRDLREEVEARLREGSRPTTAVCTSTLELGIDIGAVTSVAQIGAPPTVASLRQRLGRSGRRSGEPAILRMYVTEPQITAKTHPLDTIRVELVQTIAMVDLLLLSWFEPLDEGDLHLSTLIQQVLSLIAQHGGVLPQDAYTALCGRGPFGSVSQIVFGQLLRDMGTAALLTQAGDGLLLPGPVGERLINHYSFYAAFRTADEYRLVANGRTLGTLPIDYPVLAGSRLIFGGRRWLVLTVDDRQKVIELSPSRGGKAPHFGGNGAGVHTVIRERMLEVYRQSDAPAYLDTTARRLLNEGRDYFHRWHLDETPLIATGHDVLLFPWSGDLTHSTIAVLLSGEGLAADLAGAAIIIAGASESRVRQAIDHILDADPASPTQLAAVVGNKIVDKYDDYLGDELLDAAYAARSLDLDGAISALRHLRDRLGRVSQATTDPGRRDTPRA